MKRRDNPLPAMQVLILRRLLRGIIGDQFHLTPSQTNQVAKRVNEYASNNPLATLRALLPGAAALLAIPLWMQVGKSWPLPWYIIAELVFVTAVMGVMYWLFKRQYAKYAWRAIRKLGIADVCGTCGYDLTGLPADRAQCPECGSPRGPFQKMEEATDEHE